jgi:1-acyl-sn-glycerol-3-phosphate acyltransferase
MKTGTVVRSAYPEWVSRFAHWLLTKMGWELAGRRPDHNHTVVICYPHDTNWDLPVALLTAMALRIPIVYTLKSDWFFWPLGPIFKWLGGLPIDRSQANNVVGQVVDAMRKNPVLHLVIPPEGTRKNVKHWKMGFYWMALGANVPILPAFVDYKGRRTGVGEVIELDGDLERDFEKIRAFYVSVVGKCGEVPPKYLGAEGRARSAQARNMHPVT